MTEFITHWGYLGVLLGTAFEGEAVLLLAGIAARDGYLRLDLVILFACLGSVIADQGWFWLGRRFGPWLIRRFPNRAAPIERIGRLLDQWGSAYVLLFRFLYGVRTISPVAIGLSQISALRFSVLNLIAAVVWSVTISGLGYLFGPFIEAELHALEPWQRVTIGLLFLLMLAGIAYASSRTRSG